MVSPFWGGGACPEECTAQESSHSSRIHGSGGVVSNMCILHEHVGLLGSAQAVSTVMQALRGGGPRPEYSTSDVRSSFHSMCRR